MTTKKLVVYSASILLGTLGGCSTPQQPLIEKIANAETAIQQAQQHDAQNLAPLEMRYAQDNLHQAKQAMQTQAIHKAGQWAERALFDAKLAQAKAVSEQARQATETLRSAVDALRGPTINER